MKNNNTVRALAVSAGKLAGASFVVVLAGSGALGVAGAASRAIETVPNNSVTSAKIVDGAVASIDIKNATVASIDIANGTVASTDIADETVAAADIATNAVGPAEVADNSLTINDLGTGSVGSLEIAPNSVVPDALSVPLKPRWAHIDGGTSAVSVIAGRGVVGVTRGNTGRYQVTFDQDLTLCGWTVARTDNGFGLVSPGFVAAELGNSVSELWVRTWNTSGDAADTAEDEGFTIRVDC